MTNKEKIENLMIRSQRLKNCTAALSSCSEGMNIKSASIVGKCRAILTKKHILNGRRKFIVSIQSEFSDEWSPHIGN